MENANPIKLTTVFNFIVSGCLVLFCYWFYLHVSSELASRPKIITVDMAKLIVKTVPFSGGSGDSQQKMELKMKSIQTTIDAFKKNGYIVIDKNAIVSAPDDYEILEADLVDSEQ